jgi:cobalt/nickel transport system permease protein
MSAALADQLDRLAAGDSLLHRCDARAQLGAVVVALVCLASFPRTAVLPLLPLAVVPAAWLALGAVPPRIAALAVAAALPFVVLVGAANPWLDPQHGWATWASLALRATIGAALVAALVATSGVHRLAHAGAAVRVPQVFVVQVLLVHRYLGVLLAEAAALRRAWRLRQPSGLPSRRTAEALLTTLLGHALARAVRIHQAMRARGFAGRMPLLSPLAWRRRDTVLVAGVVLWCATCRWADPLHWLGGRLVEAAR